MLIRASNLWTPEAVVRTLTPRFAPYADARGEAIALVALEAVCAALAAVFVALEAMCAALAAVFAALAAVFAALVAVFAAHH